VAIRHRGSTWQTRELGGTWRLRVAASLPVTVLAALVPVAAGAGAAYGEPSVAEVSGATDAVSASAAARRTGHRVEVLGLRSQTGQVFANPSGTFTSEEYAQPVRVRRADGSWAPVDLTLRRAPDGSVSPVASPVDLRLSGGGDGALVTVARTGRAMSLGWPGRLPAPVLAGDTATYPEVLPGVDLRVRSLVDGFTEVLVVKDRRAAANPALRAVRFTTTTTGVGLRPGAAGSVTAVDTAGRAVFGSGTAVMWDSTPVTEGSEPRHAAMPVTVTPGGLTVTPDRGLLSDPDTVYPVFVDPSVSVGATWTMINEKHPDQSYWSYDRTSGAKVGYTDQTGSSDSYELYRSIFMFSTSTWSHKHVLGTTMSATLTHSWSCSNTRTDLYIVNSINSSTTWNNHAGSWTSDHYLDNVSNESCDDTPTYTEWGSSALTGKVQYASDNWSTITLGLRAYNESNHDYWKKFDPATAKLSVTYNTPPNTPTNLSAAGKTCVTGASRPFIGTTTPQVKATISDPDSGQVLNAAVYWAPVGAARDTTNRIGQGSLANPSTMTVSIPAGELADGGSYYVQAQAGDGTDLSPWSTTCEFTVDITRPAAPPTVTSADGVYLADGDFHGGVGRTGTFTLGANGIGDVQSYLYGLADPPTTEVQASTLGGTATVSVTPQFAGLTTLYVRSKDRAGNLSDIQRYTFLTGSATGPSAWYRVDEGSGTTLFDSSGHDNTATLGGTASWTAGRVSGPDRAVTFDGSTTYASTSGPALPTDTSFTVSAWANLRVTGSDRTVVSEIGTHTATFELGYLETYKSWSFRLRSADADSTPTVVRATATSPARTGAWTHLVGVYDAGAGQIRLYVNGVLQDTTTVGFTPWNATGPLNIGRGMWNSALNQYFDGSIDDVRVWDRVVYPDEIERIVNATTQVGYWGLDEVSGTTAPDYSGNGRDLSYYGSGLTWQAGHTGNAAHIARSGDFYRNSQVLHTDQSFSLAVWVKIDDRGDYYAAMSQDGSVVSAFYLQYDPNRDRWRFAMPRTDTSGPEFDEIFSTSVPQVGVWTHLAAVYDQVTGQMRLYVNGNREATGTHTSVWDTASSAPFRVGGAKWSGAANINLFSGSLDEARAYVGVLSDQEIVDLTNQ
jgi:hypothetical protein